jgi:hypothetical protein
MNGSGISGVKAVTPFGANFWASIRHRCHLRQISLAVFYAHLVAVSRELVASVFDPIWQGFELAMKRDSLPRSASMPSIQKTLL